MKKIKLLSTIFLATTMSISIFAGCDKNQNTNDGKGASTDHKQVEITWWAFPNFETKDGVVGKYEEELAEAFTAKNPNIKVSVEMLSFNGGGEKINAAIASNSAPDILYDAPGRIIDYARQGVLAPVDDMIAELNGDVSESILQGCK